MARKGRAVTGVMRGIVHRIDVRKACEIHQKGAQHCRADSSDDALALSGRGGSGLGTAGADGHGASLWSDSGR